MIPQDGSLGDWLGTVIFLVTVSGVLWVIPGHAIRSMWKEWRAR